jgi:hypothetical protein
MEKVLAFMDEMGGWWGLESVGTKKMCGVTFRLQLPFFFFVYFRSNSKFFFFFFFYEYFRSKYLPKKNTRKLENWSVKRSRTHEHPP